MTVGRSRIRNWSLGRVVREMGGQLISPSIGVDGPRGVSIDTRTLEQGELFFALRGDQFDGHDFVGKAIEKGACAVVVEDRKSVPETATPAILVDDCCGALQRLGHAVFRAARQDGVRSIALTGSNGKTTTKEILATIWGQKGQVWATPGNLNNHLGVPLTLCAIPAKCDYLIVEIGANHRGEIEELIQLVPAEQRLVTSIGRAHLEGFGSMAGVRKAKSEIFRNSTRRTRAIVPYKEAQALIPRGFPGTVITFGNDAGADIEVASIVTPGDGQAPQMGVHLQVEDRRLGLILPLLGEHNAENLAAAVATLPDGAVNIDPDALNEALASLHLPGGRLRTVEVGELKVMDDAYNANLSSMKASFRAFEQWVDDDDGAPKVAIIGDMHELGDSAECDHRELAAWLSRRKVLSTVVFVGEFGVVMADATEGGDLSEVKTGDDREQLTQWLRSLGKAWVFVKGSRANRLEEIIENLQQTLS